ncbi:hypothetical protein [Flavobacterium sp.]|uniref:hypothetical protein n=1 Tax=Flavobacterium sp. TaxID=239 RepID=UPI00262B9223|nr:hypothetical protein [Flavobacterium sp.]
MILNFSAIISFTAIIVGIAGNTWDKNKTGIRKVTLTGWFTVIIGLLSCTLAIIQNSINNKELNWQENQKSKIKKIAYNELNRNLESILVPYNILYSEIYLTQISDDKNILIVEAEKATYSELLSKDFLKDFKKIKFYDIPKYYPIKKNWLWLLSNNAEINEKKLNNLWLKYAVYLDTETILEINDLINDDYLADVLCMNDSINEEYYKEEYLSEMIEDNGKNYKVFFERVFKLKSKLEKKLKLLKTENNGN